MTESADPLGSAGSAEALLDDFDRLLEAGLPSAALELIVASGTGDVRRAAQLAAELRRIHFGTGAATAATAADATSSKELSGEDDAVEVAPQLRLTLEAVRVAARLRPHACGELATWEVALLRSCLP